MISMPAFGLSHTASTLQSSSHACSSSAEHTIRFTKKKPCIFVAGVRQGYENKVHSCGYDVSRVYTKLGSFVAGGSQGDANYITGYFMGHDKGSQVNKSLYGC